MPVTSEQAQMLTALAIACRPTGARRWDAAGVMANIRKLADRDLATVILAVIQAAEDRNAETPGVIPTQGPHWRAPDPARPVTLDTWDAHDVCSVCSRKRIVCEDRARVGGDDHAFVSRAVNAQQTARPSEAVARIVGDLKQRKADPTPARVAATPEEN